MEPNKGALLSTIHLSMLLDDTVLAWLGQGRRCMQSSARVRHTGGHPEHLCAACMAHCMLALAHAALCLLLDAQQHANQCEEASACGGL